jgi:hypothetical protein
MPAPRLLKGGGGPHLLRALDQGDQTLGLGRLRRLVNQHNREAKGSQTPVRRRRASATHDIGSLCVYMYVSVRVYVCVTVCMSPTPAHPRMRAHADKCIPDLDGRRRPLCRLSLSLSVCLFTSLGRVGYDGP